MGKRKMHLYLDEEAYQKVKEFLGFSGQSVSGWVNALLTELASEIDGQPSRLSKPVDEMTVKEFEEVMRYWWRKVKGIEEPIQK